jgi:hypothetical protein
MTIVFADAKPLTVAGPGRTAEPNPFTEVIKAIALVKDKEGKPVAKSFTVTHEGTEEARKSAIAKVKRQTSEAGKKNTPAVTVYVSGTPVQVKGKDSATDTLITFWTVDRQSRPRKPKDAAPAVATA